MALNTTTLSAACAATDNSILVAAATGAAPGGFVLIDGELMKIMQTYTTGTTIPVLRGRDGTLTGAHPVTANVTIFLGSDTSQLAPQAPTGFPYSGRVRTVASYSANGVIANPTVGTDALAILNGTAALAMTIASTTKDSDGSILIIAGNGKAAHTVTYTTTGFGGVGGTADVLTFSATQAQAVQMIAANGVWNLLGPLATATADVSGPSLA